MKPWNDLTLLEHLGIYKCKIFLQGYLGVKEISRLALIVPTIYKHEAVCYLWDGCSVTGVLPQGRGGEEMPILSSPQFLIRNWLGICQSHRGPPTEFLPQLGEGKSRAMRVGRELYKPGSWELWEWERAEKGSTEGELGGNSGWWKEAMEPWC